MWSRKGPTAVASYDNSDGRLYTRHQGPFFKIDAQKDQRLIPFYIYQRRWIISLYILAQCVNDIIAAAAACPDFSCQIIESAGRHIALVRSRWSASYVMTVRIKGESTSSIYLRSIHQAKEGGTSASSSSTTTTPNNCSVGETIYMMR